MDLARVADIVLLAAALPVAIASGYLLLLALLSWPRTPPAYAEARLAFDMVVPAHDEESGIADTVRSLLAVDYPERLRRVLVVADNCQDATAACARTAGATVLERQDPVRRGKGYALAHGFAESLAGRFADAVVVVDADTTVSPNLLRAFAARLEAGALAVQSDNAVRNPTASWRTCLMAVAFATIHAQRCLARDRLGVSTGLRGNGMCFATRLLREVPWQAFSIVEDLEYGIRLGLAGHRVRFAAEAQVRSEMVSDPAAASSQRRRWEGGRFRLARAEGLPLLGRGVLRRDPVLLDLGMDLLVPPLAYLAGAAAAGGAISTLAAELLGRRMDGTWIFAASLGALAVYAARGWWLSGTGLRGLAALVHVPRYFLWKVQLLRHSEGHERDGWVRTPRHPS